MYIDIFLSATCDIDNGKWKRTYGHLKDQRSPRRQKLAKHHVIARIMHTLSVPLSRYYEY